MMNVAEEGLNVLFLEQKGSSYIVAELSHFFVNFSINVDGGLKVVLFKDKFYL